MILLQLEKKKTKDSKSKTTQRQRSKRHKMATFSLISLPLPHQMQEEPKRVRPSGMGWLPPHTATMHMPYPEAAPTRQQLLLQLLHTSKERREHRRRAVPFEQDLSGHVRNL
jgi:hypothetical protein